MGRGITIILAIFVISVLITSLYLYSNRSEFSYLHISGESIKDIPKLPLDISISLIAFVTQWFILISIILFAYARYLKKKKYEKVTLNIQEIRKKKSGTETDLDLLYRALKDKKKLPIDLISKSFKIDKEKAIEWSKILENSGLATLEYPAFGEPEVKLNEKGGGDEEENPKPKEEGDEKKEQREKKSSKKRK